MKSIMKKYKDKPCRRCGTVIKCTGPMHHFCEPCRKVQANKSSKKYRDINITVIRARDRINALEWERTHPEEAAAKKKAYQLKNLAKFRESNKRYNQRYPGKWRVRHLRNNFNITIDEYEVTKTHQNNLCAICGQPETSQQNNKTRHLAVDHKHDDSRKVRGLLCRRCNHMLGFAMDSELLCLRAAVYLALSEGRDRKEILHLFHSILGAQPNETLPMAIQRWRCSSR